jgi:poly-gamma-glutamate synthase PgsB/CapB
VNLPLSPSEGTQVPPHDPTTNAVLFTVFTLAFLLVAGWMLRERRRHDANLSAIPIRVCVNGIRGKSSITRLVAGALRRSPLIVAAKTTGSAARFIYPGGREVPIKRPYDMINVVEQIGVVAKAAGLKVDALVVECMAVDPALQELNQKVLIKADIVVICNVREDHLEEMGPTLDDVARSLCRSMPTNGLVVTAERERFHILQEEAFTRNCLIYYANPDSVSDAEMAPFTWITFKDNVAIALEVANLCGISRQVALAGMYQAEPDPGALQIIKSRRGPIVFQSVNLFAANDPESTLMNVALLRERKLLTGEVYLVINCRDDRVERNVQMGAIVEQIKPSRVFVIGQPTKSATNSIHESYRDRVTAIEGNHHDGEYLLELITRDMPEAGVSLVMVGNIHGQGEVLLGALETDGADLSDELFDLEVADLMDTVPISPVKE